MVLSAKQITYFFEIRGNDYSDKNIKEYNKALITFIRKKYGGTSKTIMQKFPYFSQREALFQYLKASVKNLRRHKYIKKQRGYYKMKKRQMIDIIVASEFDLLKKVKDMARENRKMLDAPMKNIRQHPIKGIPIDADFNEVVRDPELEMFNNIIFEEIKSVLILLFNDRNVKRAYISVLYAFSVESLDENDRVIYTIDFRHTKTIEAFNTGKEGEILKIDELKELNTGGNESGFRHIYVGYRIAYVLRDNINEVNDERMMELKAFSPSDNINFHKLCAVSTSMNSQLCIYETFLHNYTKFDLKNKHKQNKKYTEQLNKWLDEEGEEIKKNVKEGNLVESVKLLCIKYGVDALIVFYGSLISKERDEEGIYRYIQNAGDNKPIVITRTGTAKETLSGALAFFEGKTQFLYDDGKHVAPFVFKPLDCVNGQEYKTCFKYAKNTKEEGKAPSVPVDILEEAEQEILEEEKNEKIKKNETIKDLIKKKQFTYKLSPCEVKKAPSVPVDTLAFDFETYTDNETNARVYACCVYGELGIYEKEKKKKKAQYILIGKKHVEKAFYGEENTVKQELAEYINSISTKMNNSRTHAHTKIPKIFVYGFNNSCFDNLLIYQELYKTNREIKNVFAGNSIKFIKFHNVMIYDLRNYYTTSLKKLAESFELEQKKGVFPYTFTNKDNLYYIGEVPDVKYWKDEKERDIYIKEEGHIFNMKEYTLKYCMLDSKLTYEIAKLHQESAMGEINGKYYNCIKCPTAAGISTKMLCQVYLKESLIQSPENIIIDERASYKGGRTEVFKKYFKSFDGKYLWYYDINTAHPSGMVGYMPVKYELTHKYKVPVVYTMKDIDNITETDLYICKSRYIGEHANTVIPNLLTKYNGRILPLLNTDYAPHWGNEVIEAILNGFEITINKKHIYKRGNILEEFSRDCYEKRSKLKKTKPAKANFFKLVPNSLYGKFGQRAFNDTGIIQNERDFLRIAKNDMNKVVSIKYINDSLAMVEYKNMSKELNDIGKLVRFSSYIASTTRCKLSKIMRAIGHEHIYYCDTDSIFTDKKPPAEFLDLYELGKWKLETVEETPNGIKELGIIEAQFLAPKLYMYELENGKIKKGSKGMKSEQLTKEDYTKMLNGGLVSKSATMFFRSLDGIKIKDQTRTVQQVLNKRKWEGNNSTPYDDISEWEGTFKEDKKTMTEKLKKHKEENNIKKSKTNQEETKDIPKEHPKNTIIIDIKNVQTFEEFEKKYKEIQEEEFKKEQEEKEAKKMNDKKEREEKEAKKITEQKEKSEDEKREYEINYINERLKDIVNFDNITDIIKCECCILLTSRGLDSVRRLEHEYDRYGRELTKKDYADYINGAYGVDRSMQRIDIEGALKVNKNMKHTCAGKYPTYIVNKKTNKLEIKF